MAKQSGKVVKSRIAELCDLGYGLVKVSEDVYDYRLGESIISWEIIETTTKAEWDNLMKALVSEIDRQNYIPLSVGENTQLQAASGKATMSLQTLEVAKFSLTEAEFTEHLPAIKNWETECMALTIADLKDKAAYKAVMAAKSLTRKTRTTLENVRKEKKAYWLAGGKEVDDVAKKYFSNIEDTEAHLDAEIAKYEAWVTEEDRRKEEESKAELTRRVAALKENGMVFTGAYYAIGPIMSMDLSTIQAMTTIEFDVFTGKVKMEKSRLDEIAEQERQAEETRKENERKEREEFERKQQELANKQAEFDRKEKELADATERIRKQKITIRESQLMQVGLTFCARIPILGESGYYFKIGEVEQWVAMSAIEIMEDADFEGKIEYLKTTVSDAKQKADAAAEQERIAKETAKARQQQLIGLGLVWQQHLSAFTYARENAPTKCVVAIGEITGQSADRWEQTLADVKSTIESINQEQDEYDAAEKKKALEYHERQTSLINAGMQIVGPNFVRKNEFGTSAFITIDEVKAIDPDNWSRRLLEVQGEIAKVNQDADTKRQEIIAAKEALKPQAQKVREYIEGLNVIKFPTEITDTKIGGILADFMSQFENISESALNELSELEK